MPGAAAWAEVASSNAAVAPTTERNPDTVRRSLVFTWLMIAFLRDDYDFSHQAAKVFGVVRQVVELWRVQEIGARRYTGAVDDHIEGLTAAERDGVRLDVKVVPRLVAQYLGVEAHQQHRNANRRERLVFQNVQVVDA